MSGGRQLHLNANLLGPGAHQAAWRAPEGNPRAIIDLAHYQAVAREAERGLLDAVFLSDGVLLKGVGATMPVQSLDPAVLVTAMALATSRVGFVATVSTTFSSPYSVARTFASIDHLSGGRVAWNVVTTRDRGAADNFGLADLPLREDRYARAAEFIDVVQRLWDSWEDAALVADPAAGRFSDPTRIHAIDHVGPHFSVKGPLQVPRSPQGQLPIVQAGGSDKGRDLAARYASIVFTSQHVLRAAQEFYADIKARAAAYGRDPAQVHVLPGLNPVVGSTEEEARRRVRQMNELIGDDQRLRQFAGFLGVSLEGVELEMDKPFPAHLLRPTDATYGSTGFDDSIRALVASRELTVRELLDHGTAHRTIVGTPEQIADTIEEWFRAGAADGFNLQCDVYPAGLTAFVDHVVPELQRRGLFRRQYDGATLREHYGLDRPPSVFECRPAAVAASAAVGQPAAVQASR